MRPPHPLWVLALIAACAQGGDSDVTDTSRDTDVDTGRDSAADTDEDSDTDATPPFAPLHGLWDYAEQDPPTVDPCDLGDDLTDGIADHDQLYLDVTTTSTVTLVPVASDQALYDCVLTGQDFSCTEAYRARIDDAGWPPDLDVVLKVWATATGTFTSPTRAAGTQSGRVVCDGPDCDQLEGILAVTFPCQVVVDFTAEHAAD